MIKQKVKAGLRLMRPPNIVTALADIIAGFSVSTLFSMHDVRPLNLLWLLITTIGLYGGGVVFNDVFDYSLDCKERPERPLPKRKITLNQAISLGIILLLISLGAAYQVSYQAFTYALIICFFSFLYNSYSKHQEWLGPLNMGLCRSCNLLLGASHTNGAFWNLWPLPMIPVIFVAALTMVSQNEVHGGSKRLWIAAFLYTLVISVTLLVISYKGLNIIPSLGLLLLFSYQNFVPLYQAIKNPSPLLIQTTVKSGVISIITLNAAITAGFAGWLWGLCVLGLLPLSIGLAKKFSVT